MQLKHTPGPWVADDAKSPPGRPAIEKEIVAGIRHIAQVRLFEDEDSANARLIAAAPELLEACKAVLEGVNGDLDNERFRAFVERVCSSAIAKAGGAQ